MFLPVTQRILTAALLYAVEHNNSTQSMNTEIYQILRRETPSSTSKFSLFWRNTVPKKKKMYMYIFCLVTSVQENIGNPVD